MELANGEEGHIGIQWNKRMLPWKSSNEGERDSCPKNGNYGMGNAVGMEVIELLQMPRCLVSMVSCVSPVPF